jgi:hypothetical protein
VIARILPIFMAFDLLQDGRELTGRPLRDRRVLLESVVAGSEFVMPVRRLRFAADAVSRARLAARDVLHGEFTHERDRTALEANAVARDAAGGVGGAQAAGDELTVGDTSRARSNSQAA